MKSKKFRDCWMKCIGFIHDEFRRNGPPAVKFHTNEEIVEYTATGALDRCRECARDVFEVEHFDVVQGESLRERGTGEFLLDALRKG